MIVGSILTKNQFCSKQNFNTYTHFDTFSPTEKLPIVVLPTAVFYEYITLPYLLYAFHEH